MLKGLIRAFWLHAVPQNVQDSIEEARVRLSAEPSADFRKRDLLKVSPLVQVALNCQREVEKFARGRILYHDRKHVTAWPWRFVYLSDARGPSRVKESDDGR